MMNALAILGGQPLFGEPRHVGAPHVPDREAIHGSLDAILDSRRFSNDGPFVQHLERALAEQNGARHAVAMSNATIALQLVFRALGLTGEVIMPSFTFIATAHAATWEGLAPVFVDIDPRTHCIDPRAVAAAITGQTAAIVGVHVWGGLCDADSLGDVADTRNVPLIFDAAHALGCAVAGRAIGSMGRASVISLHATKVVSGLEGGAVLTDDDDLAARLRTMRNFGFEGYDSVGMLGINAKMNEFSAAFAIAGLMDFPRLVARNAAVADVYREGLSRVPGVRLIQGRATHRTNHHYIVAMIDPCSCPLDRDSVQRVLEAENVLARRYFYPGCHRMQPYAGGPSGKNARLPVTDAVAAQVLVLPAGGSVTPEEAWSITQRIRVACENATDVHQALSAKRACPSVGRAA